MVSSSRPDWVARSISSSTTVSHASPGERLVRSDSLPCGSVAKSNWGSGEDDEAEGNLGDASEVLGGTEVSFGFVPPPRTQRSGVGAVPSLGSRVPEAMAGRPSAGWPSSSDSRGTWR